MINMSVCVCVQIEKRERKKRKKGKSEVRGYATFSMTAAEFTIETPIVH
jgi:hypothetical protein